MIEKMGGRKFIFAIFAIVLAFVLVILSKIESSFFLDFVKFIGVTYVAGNTAVNIAGIIKAKTTTIEEEGGTNE